MGAYDRAETLLWSTSADRLAGLALFYAKLPMVYYIADFLGHSCKAHCRTRL